MIIGGFPVAGSAISEDRKHRGGNRLQSGACLTPSNVAGRGLNLNGGHNYIEG